MKFSDGYWMSRAGVRVEHPMQVFSVSEGADGDASSLTVTGPTKAITTRGDTLNRALITVRLSTPMLDVIRVQVHHHSGGLESHPQFELAAVPAPAGGIDVTAEYVAFEAGGLTARVRREDFVIEFEAGGSVLTRSPAKGIGVVKSTPPVDTRTAGAPAGHYVYQQLTLRPGEAVYGLGERFGPVVKNGQQVDLWNADGGTSSEQAYKNVPFFLSTAGYGVFVNHPEHVSFEIGSEFVTRNQFSVAGQTLDYFVIHGPTPKQILTKYTALTGRPAAVPDWSFGLWLSTSFTTSYDEATVSAFVDGMADHDLSLSVFHFDCFWMRPFRWCDFEWDPATFPDPAGMLSRLKARGLRICVWINPYIAQASPLFEEGREGGYLLTRPDGSIWQWDMWQAGMALVDFTNPAAARWFSSKLEVLLDQGVDAFKTDFGERIPTDVRWYDGSDPQRMHNYYAQLYNRTVFELLERRRGTGEAVLFARSATAGGQQFPVHWGGDSESTYSSMAETLRGGLSLSLSGFGYWSHDIGGFEGVPDAGVFKRWLAFGLLSSHSRLHGSGSYRVPWLFDQEAVEVTRAFNRLKMLLMPYLRRLADDAATVGIPMMRHMLLEFPDDRSVVHLETQYMLGDALLVAPVFTPTGEVEYYLPAGVWTQVLTGEELVGPRWVRETHDVLSIPLLARPDSVVPLGAVHDRPDYLHDDAVTLQVFAPADGCRHVLHVGASTFVVERHGRQVVAVRTLGSKRWGVVVGSAVSGAAVNWTDGSAVTLPLASRASDSSQ